LGRTITWNGRTVVLKFVWAGGRLTYMATGYPRMRQMPQGAYPISDADANKWIADATQGGVSGSVSPATHTRPSTDYPAE
jgi:hypothetical protein